MIISSMGINKVKIRIANMYIQDKVIVITVKFM